MYHSQVTLERFFFSGKRPRSHRPSKFTYSPNTRGECCGAFQLPSCTHSAEVTRGNFGVFLIHSAETGSKRTGAINEFGKNETPFQTFLSPRSSTVYLFVSFSIDKDARMLCLKNIKKANSIGKKIGKRKSSVE